jgi:hypothetical protein
VRLSCWGTQVMDVCGTLDHANIIMWPSTSAVPLHLKRGVHVFA